MTVMSFTMSLKRCHLIFTKIYLEILPTRGQDSTMLGCGPKLSVLTSERMGVNATACLHDQIGILAAGLLSYARASSDQP